MRKTIAVAIAATLGLTAVAPIEAADAPKGAPKKGGGTVTLMPAGDIKWVPVEGFPEVKMAPVQGDPAKGPNHTMQKLPAGFAAPLHHHSSDHYATVLTGTLVLTVDGKETKLPPGSYFAFTGKRQHMTKCEAGADCTLFVDARGKWDVVPEEGKAPAKK